jgi:DEAD/DEAH box helicase domain-containing protein
LTGLPFKEVKEDTSPSGKRWFIFWNPPFILGKEKRRSSNLEATELLVEALRSGVKTIVFSKSKQSAELIFKYAQERLKEVPQLAQALAVYRAGYLPQERRQIEKKLFAGELKGVSATSALELGIDIGNLDVSILNGYPGTISSTWQQAGRAGRKTQKCVSILVAQEDPLDQYFMNHPQDFFKRSHEAAIIDVENPYLLFQHLLCAAYEYPLTLGDQMFFGQHLTAVLDKLVSLGFLKQKGEKWYLQKKTYPAKEINLRSSSQESFSIVEAETGCLLGTLDENTAFLYVHPGAIYLHQGESYLVLELNVGKKVAIVKQESLPYFTQPREESSLEILKIKEKGGSGQVQAWLGEVEVTTRVTAFQKKAILTGKVIGKEYLDLPPQRFRTEAAWFIVPETLIEKLQLNQHQLAGGLHAIEHGAIALLPLIALCDRWDVGGVSTPTHHQTDEASIFIYDAYQGGVGIARRCFNQINTHLSQTYHLIKDCPCDEGCPSCIQSPKCGNWNEPLDKEAAISILKELLTH